MTRSDAVANAQRAGRFPTKARLCRESCRSASFFFGFFRRFNSLKNRSAGSRYIIASRRAILVELIIRKIIRPILRWRSKHLIALYNSAAMSARNVLIFVRVGRDDPGAARRQAINQPSIGRNSKHSDAH